MQECARKKTMHIMVNVVARDEEPSLNTLLVALLFSLLQDDSHLAP